MTFVLGTHRLLRGAPPGRARLSRPAQSVLLTWIPVFAAPSLVIGLVAVLAPNWITVAGLVGGLLTAIALLTAAAIDATVPPPHRPNSQRSTLGDEPHPFTPYFASTGLREYVPGQVWLAQAPLSFLGLPVATRMTIVRTGPDELLVHSPIELTDALRTQVQALGRVRYVVAPNVLHHLYVGPWLAAWPGAEAFAAPGLAERRPDLPWTATLDEQFDPPWPADAVELAVLRGHPFWIEVALLHRPSRTLVLSDALMNLGHAPDNGPGLRLLLELLGMAQRPAPPMEIKLGFDDRAAARRGVEAILGWDFDRIIVAHGRLIEREAKETFADGWAFVYDE